jgi:protein gp37
MDGTKIEWTDATWNPLRGCSRVSEGCRNCYAERVAARFNGPGLPYEGIATSMTTKYADGKQVTEARWTGEIKLVEDVVEQPIRWRRPRRIFVNSMSDLFHEKVPESWLDRIFAVMMVAGIQRWHCSREHDCEKANCASVRADPKDAYGPHTFQILTKRPERMLAYLRDDTVWCRVEEEAEKMGYGDALEGADGVLTGKAGNAWLKNVWLGVSVEDQAAADKRIPILLDTPAAVRWISAEPLLGPLELHDAFWRTTRTVTDEYESNPRTPRLDWVVVGGESGPGARACSVHWIERILEQCREADVPSFAKQLGARPTITNVNLHDWADHVTFLGDGEGAASGRAILRDSKGGDMSEWPEELRVRRFPGQMLASGEAR